MAQTDKSKFYACDLCNKAFSSKYAMNRHRSCSHLETATKFTCAFEDCTYSCYRPEDLLMHEKRHSDPTFKTRKQKTNRNNNSTTAMQTTDSSDQNVGYSHQEFVQALQQQLSETNQDAYSTIDFSYFQEDPQVITTLNPEPTSSSVATIPDQNIYQPPVSNITTPEASHDETPSAGPVYHPGLHIYADQDGNLKTDPNYLVPGMKYVCSNTFELFGEDTEQYKTMTKGEKTEEPALTSFTVNIMKNPGKNNVNECNTQ